MSKATCKTVYEERISISTGNQLMPGFANNEPSAGVLVESWTTDGDHISHYMITMATVEKSGEKFYKYHIEPWWGMTDAKMVRKAITMLDEAIANHPDAGKVDQAPERVNLDDEEEDNGEEIPY